MRKTDASIAPVAALPETDHLRSFAMVAELGSVTAAAQALGRTQSAISVQMKRLEETVGAQLLTREARGVSLTDAGLRLLPTARQVLGALRAAQSGLCGAVSGSVSIGVPDDLGPRLMEQVLTRFARAHPNAEVKATCGFSAGFPELVRRGALDLALYSAEMSDPDGETLFDEPLVWAARADWTPPDGPLPLALFDRACWWREIAVEALAAAGRPFAIAFSSESLMGVRAAIGAGLAVGVLARRTLTPGMRILTGADAMPPLPLSRIALISGAQADSPAAKAMAATIRETLLRGETA